MLKKWLINYSYAKYMKATLKQHYMKAVLNTNLIKLYCHESGCILLFKINGHS